MSDSDIVIVKFEWLKDVLSFLKEVGEPTEPGYDGYHDRGDMGRKCKSWCIACRAKKLIDSNLSPVRKDNVKS